MAEHPLAGRPPSKIVAVHVSYRSRAMERGAVPPWPSYFLKPPGTLAASGDPVRRPPGSELLAFEGEVALVVVVPRDIAREVAADAREQERQEEFIAEQVAKGASVEGLYPLGGNWRPAYEQWVKERS
jgi:hypothetical protein